MAKDSVLFELPFSPIENLWWKSAGKTKYGYVQFIKISYSFKKRATVVAYCMAEYGSNTIIEVAPGRLHRVKVS